MHITVQDTDALARKIQQVKAVLDRAKHPVSPMTEVHLTHLERCLNPLLLESIVKNKPLVDEMAMIKQQVGCRIRDAEHIMNFVDEGKPNSSHAVQHSNSCTEFLMVTHYVSQPGPAIVL